MQQDIVNLIVSQGIFCALFVWLLWDTRKDSRSREERYQDTITNLADKISIVEDIKADVVEIKNKISI